MYKYLITIGFNNSRTLTGTNNEVVKEYFRSYGFKILGTRKVHNSQPGITSSEYRIKREGENTLYARVDRKTI